MIRFWGMLTDLVNCFNRFSFMQLFYFSILEQIVFVIVNYRGSLLMDSFSYMFRNFSSVVTTKIDVLSSLDYSDIFKYEAKNSPDVSMLWNNFECCRDFFVCMRRHHHFALTVSTDLMLILICDFPLIFLSFFSFVSFCCCLFEFSIKITQYLVKMQFPSFLLKILIRCL